MYWNQIEGIMRDSTRKGDKKLEKHNLDCY